MIRTTPVDYGAKPYVWGIDSVYECTWYTYYRALEEGLLPPCYWDRPTRTGSYTHAKKWLAEFREPWIPIYAKDNPDYIPSAHDIVVFDGHYGHVAFIEKMEGKIATLSQYKSGKKDSFSNYQWEAGTDYTGKLLGYLHYPNNHVNPVPRNPKVDQILTTDKTLRVRLAPNLNGDIYCFVQLGYYDVLSQTSADDYIWYEIEKGKYVANITTNFLPAEQSVETILKENKDLLERMKQIHLLSEEI